MYVEYCRFALCEHLSLSVAVRSILISCAVQIGGEQTDGYVALEPSKPCSCESCRALSENVLSQVCLSLAVCLLGRGRSPARL